MMLILFVIVVASASTCVVCAGTRIVDLTNPQHTHTRRRFHHMYIGNPNVCVFAYVFVVRARLCETVAGDVCSQV